MFAIWAALEGFIDLRQGKVRMGDEEIGRTSKRVRNSKAGIWAVREGVSG